MNQALQNELSAQLPLSDLDPSKPDYFSTGEWERVFARLRDEDPVHYTADSPFGPFWSVTRFEDIVAIDTNHQQFSSARGIIIDSRDFRKVFRNLVKFRKI